MDVGTKFRRNNNKTKFIKSYEGKEIVESSGRLPPESIKNKKKSLSTNPLFRKDLI